MADVQVTNGNGFKTKPATILKVGAIIFLCGGFYYRVESLETKQAETDKQLKELVQMKSDIESIKAGMKELNGKFDSITEIKVRK